MRYKLDAHEQPRKKLDARTDKSGRSLRSIVIMGKSPISDDGMSRNYTFKSGILERLDIQVTFVVSEGYGIDA